MEKEDVAKQEIKCIRRGSDSLSEDEWLQIGTRLLQAGYTVHIERNTIPSRDKQIEYRIQYWED